MRHCHGQGQRPAPARITLRVKLDRQLGLRDHPAAPQRVVGTEFLISHIPDGSIRFGRIFERDPPALVINRHQAQLAHFDPLDPVLKISRKSKAIEKHRQIVMAHRDFFAAELDTK